MEKLIQNILSKTPFIKDLEPLIQDYFKLETLPKNHLLLKENQYCRKLYFLEKGTVRTFYTAKDKEVSSWFYKEGQFFTAWYSFHGTQASFEGIETLEECQLYSIEREPYLQLMEKHPTFERFGRLLAETQLSFIDFYSKGYMFLTAKERYDLLLSFFPDIELRVKLGYIASHLGISQATLSRIRSKGVPKI